MNADYADFSKPITAEYAEDAEELPSTNQKLLMSRQLLMV
jgi:hypothetical protein